ncbi:HEAT repeat domain-containing protein [Actinomadura madurae]|uniref:HEAT repeat domain-containing protein n=1 Tax=Actinomadura madurae TaxID=1993 RepID=UPI0020D2026C|nr:HEAT repeat domain-containing protein [Actinomadura madurae]MCP9978358.1 HEAT repeat domain-containing protein [Actinomadura madurae]MCQ0010120.1 HEAT repeat domain-containing protein [Actinomadura madurae]MCQ0014565.1 HEAT repeat domain-containing protein [Actinomadura madurae]
MFPGSQNRKLDRLKRKVDRLEQKRDVARLADLLGHGDILVYSRAREALERIVGDAAIDPVFPFLGHPVGAVRAEISGMLGRIGDPRAVPVLVPLLVETGRIRDENGRATRFSSYETISSITAGALGRIGDPSVKDALIGVLADGEFSGLREPLLSALVAVAGSEVAGALLALLRDRDAATPALGRLSGPVARQVLIDTLDGRNDIRARHPVLQAMVKVNASGTVNALAELARSGGEQERRAAIAALDLGHFVEMNDAEADAALRDVLDPDGALRAALEADGRAAPGAPGAGGDDDEAVANLRLIIRDPGYAVIPNGATYRDRAARKALDALEDIVAQRGDGVPRRVLYAGATLDDFVVWTEIDGEPMGLRITAAGLRHLCLSALLRQDSEVR